jgi:tight adherence protein C
MGAGLFFFLYLGAAAGYFLPNFFLRAAVKFRKEKVFRELPDALDLSLVCLDAGLSFNKGLERVSKELRGLTPILSEEFGHYFYEVESGLSRLTALDNLAKRNGVEPLTSVMNVLIQSARLGTDIVEALRVYSESLRTERMQIAEEKAAKISTKMTIPMVLFILPALILVVTGPALIRLIQGFKFLNL